MSKLWSRSDALRKTHGLGARAETVNLFCDSCAKADRVVISNGDVPVFFCCTPMSRARMRRSRDTILCTALFVETFLRSPHLRECKEGYPKALRTNLFRLLGPKTMLEQAFGLF